MLSKIKNIATKTIGNLILKPYFKIRTQRLIWLFLNRNSRDLFRTNPPSLNETQDKTINTLFQEGIAETHLDELFPKENKLEKLQQYALYLKNQSSGKQTSKTFLTYLLDPKPELDFENEIVKIALDPKVLAIVNSYFGMLGKFYYFTLNITHPVPAGTEAEQSQKWHRDPEDIKMLKMFVYLNDVDDEAGPFIYVPKSNLGNKWNKIFPQRPPIGYYPQERELEKVVPQSDIKKYVGKAGSVIFGDTTGLHKGGYATKKERLMLTIGYAPSSSPLAEQYTYSEEIKKRLATLTPAQKYAIILKPSKLNTYILKKFRKFFKRG
ncbi:MAG: hypothetical protein AAB556_02610 [Patescibacteria group bacterium]